MALQVKVIVNDTRYTRGQKTDFSQETRNKILPAKPFLVRFSQVRLESIE
jgi:hypothetical protein